MDFDGDSCLLWERRHAELVQWKNERGNCNVPKAEGKLGRWVVRQRELQKKGKLEKGRKNLLDDLAFVWNTNEAAWETRYAQLKQYATVHGHCCVPISDPMLGMWVAKMRANRRRGKLPQHRVCKLDMLAFVWNTAEADWMDKFNKLLIFREREGHACVPFNEGELGWWVNTQRQSKRKGKLSKDREQLLNKAGFIWNPQTFLAARRKEAATAKAKAVASMPLDSPHTRERSSVDASLSTDFADAHLQLSGPASKRQKLLLSPVEQKSLFRSFTESAGTTPSAYSKPMRRLKHLDSSLTQAASFLDTPLSNVTATPQTGHVGLMHLSPPRDESVSSFPTDRVDVQSIASLLSPSTSPMPFQNVHAVGFGMGGSIDLPSFHNDRTASGLMRSRRPPSPYNFVLPPISSLKVLTEISRH